MKKFNEYNGFNLSDINKEVLQQWDKEDVFGRSISEREGSPAYVFYEGPPSANGMPGIHHVMARSIKDIFCRYKTMQGYQVPRKAGWDTHGLPVELGVEKALGITKEDIGKKISVDEYNATCRKEVMKYTREWEDLTHRMGDDGQRRRGCNDTRQCGSHTCTSDNHLHATFLGRLCKLLHSIGSTMGREGIHFKGHLQLIEQLTGFLHNGQVTRATHDNTD